MSKGTTTRQNLLEETKILPIEQLQRNEGQFYGLPKNPRLIRDERFEALKKCIHDRLDHQNLNDILPFNPTAENIAKWVCDQVPNCYKVSVQESEGNIATYIKDTSHEEVQD